MKAVLLEKYRINARAIAEAMWGTGGTNAAKTNRKFTYYYSCSAHGGYVIPTYALTDEEKAKLNEYTTPISFQLLIQHRREGDFVIGVSLTNIQRCCGRNKGFRYNPSLGPCEWQDYEFYAFEEDCDWAILEKLTNIRASGSTVSEEKRQEIIDSTFNRWAKKLTPDGEKS